MKIKLLLFKFTLLFSVFFYLNSCGSQSNGMFEKRKHLKGWHFHKHGNLSAEKSSEKFKSDYKRDAKKDTSEIQHQHSVVQIERYSSIQRRAGLEKHSSEDIDIKSLAWKTTVKNEKSNTDSVEESLENKNYSNKEVVNGKEQTDTYTLENTESSSDWYLNSTFFLLFLAPMLIKGRKTSRIQYWAAKNQPKAQGVLTVMKLAAVGTSIGLGYLVQPSFSQSHLFFAAGFIGLSFGLWQYWKEQNSLSSTRRMGLMSVVNAATSFSFFTLGGMLSHSSHLSNWSLVNGVVNEDPVVNVSTSHISTLPAVLIIIGMTLLLILLLYLILIVSCRLLCMGAEVFAVLLFVFASYLIISFYLYLIFKLTAREERENSWFFKKAFLFGMLGPVFFALISFVFFTG